MRRHSIVALGVLALVLGLSARPARAADVAAEPARAHATDAAAAGHAAGAGEAEGAGENNILEPQPSLAIWTVVVFIGLLLVLRQFAWKPLLQALHQREEHLEHCLLETERARNESEQLLAEHRRQLAEASDQVRALIEQARRDAQAGADELLSKARAEAEAERHRAKQDIDTARDQALMDIWSKTADLAVSVAGRVLAREMGEAERRRLVDAAIGELPAGPTSTNGQGGRTA